MPGNGRSEINRLLTVDWGRVFVLSSSVLLWVFLGCSGVEVAGKHSQISQSKEVGLGYILHTLLCPLQIFLHFLRLPHSVCEVGACSCQSSLGERLKFKKFPVFGVELARSARNQKPFAKKCSDWYLNLATHVWDCFARLRSRGIGLNAPWRRSPMYSIRSTPAVVALES